MTLKRKMKLPAFAPLLLLLGCGDASAPSEQARRDAPAATPPDDGRIECAIGGAPFERRCTVERRESERGAILTLRHPDGGFRRLLLPGDGSAVVAADRAEPAPVSEIGDGRSEVAIGRDRYRLPARTG